VPVTPRRRALLRGATAALSLAAVIALALVPTLGAAAAPGVVPVSRSSDGAPAGTPVSLAVLVPLTVRPTVSGLLDATTLAGYTAPLGVLTRQLDAVYDTPAVIGLDPMIIASIRVLGTAAPPSAIAWLQRLQTARNEVFALAYADADVTSLARVNALALQAPIGFDFAIDPSHFGPAATATPTPSATPTDTPTPSPTPSAAETPALPTTTEEVLDWTYTLSNIAWPADDSVIPADLAPLKDAGYRDVVLSSTNLSAATSGAVDLGSLKGIVADAGISSLVREAVYETGSAALDTSLGRLNSALTGMEALSPGRTVVATLDRHWPLGSLNLDALFADLATQTSLKTVGLTTVLAGPHPGAQVVQGVDDATRLAQLRSIVIATGEEAAFATAATVPNLVLEPRRLQLLSLLAVTWLRGTDDWSTEVGTFLSDSAALRDSVKIVSGSDLFVGAGQTNIPVTVSNALKYPVTVYVNVASTNSRLQVQKQNVALKVEPGSSNKAAIPVQALSDGRVVATVTIVSVERVALGAPDYVSIDLQPGWESVGTTVIVVLLVLIFGGGIARNIYKRRKARRLASAPQAVEPSDESAERHAEQPAEHPRD
jgi:hypothetical protein